MGIKNRWKNPDGDIGRRVKATRELRGWTQAKLAELLVEHGIEPMHTSTVQKIEAGDRSVSVGEAAGIADVFGLSLDALLGRNPPKNRSALDAIGWVMDATYTMRASVDRDGKGLRSRLGELPRFDGRAALVGAGREALECLDAGRAALDRLEEQAVTAMERESARLLLQHKEAGK